jgi:hypothetical protein
MDTTRGSKSSWQLIVDSEAARFLTIDVELVIAY